MAPSCTMVTTSSCSLLLIYRPQQDERLSWPNWLNYSGQFTHISGHLSAVGWAQNSESSPVKDQRSTAVPRKQPLRYYTVFQKKVHPYDFHDNSVRWKPGLVRFLNRNRNRGFFHKPRKTETAISPCIRDDFLPETLKFPMSAVSKYMKFNSL